MQTIDPVFQEKLRIQKVNGVLVTDKTDQRELQSHIIQDSRETLKGR